MSDSSEASVEASTETTSVSETSTSTADTGTVSDVNETLNWDTSSPPSESESRPIDQQDGGGDLAEANQTLDDPAARDAADWQEWRAEGKENSAEYSEWRADNARVSAEDDLWNADHARDAEDRDYYLARAAESEARSHEALGEAAEAREDRAELQADAAAIRSDLAVDDESRDRLDAAAEQRLADADAWAKEEDSQDNQEYDWRRTAIDIQANGSDSTAE